MALDVDTERLILIVCVLVPVWCGFVCLLCLCSKIYKDVYTQLMKNGGSIEIECCTLKGIYRYFNSCCCSCFPWYSKIEPNRNTQLITNLDIENQETNNIDDNESITSDNEQIEELSIDHNLNETDHNLISIVNSYAREIELRSMHTCK